MALLTAEDIHLQFRDRVLFEGATLAVEARDRLGIVGANGTGKSTFMKIMVGALAPDLGRVTRARGLRVGYLAQELPEPTADTVVDAVLAGAPRLKDLEERLAEIEAELGGTEDAEVQLALSAELAELHDELADLGRRYGRHRAEAILLGLRFVPADLDKRLDQLSGGWRMRAALAALLFQNPDVLFLDEPTNHLDMPSVQWLDGFLKSYPHALVLICHDREFLNRHVTRVASLEVEGLRTYKGNYDAYKVQRADELELLENRAKNEEKRRADLEAFVERFRAKASKARQAQSKAKQLEKMMEDVVELPEVRRAVSIRFPPAERAGDTVVDVRGVTQRYGEKRVLDGVDLAARRGDRIAIVGLNGAGKTTLLKIVAGELPPSGGGVKLGHNVTMSYFAQHHADVLRRDATVLDEVWRARADLSPTEARNLCGAFLFSGDDVDKPIGVLSGGERARVALARLLVRPGNLLLLDEPTNHLDTESAEKLTASLETYDGTLLFVSHSLDFARRLSNKVWSVHDGQVEVYPGSLGDYLEKLRAEDLAREGAEADARASGPVADDKEARLRQREADKRAQNDKKKQKAKLEKQLAELEAKIAALEAEQAKLEAELADPATHADVAKGRATSKRYDEVRRGLEAAMGSWAEAGDALASLG